MIISLKIFVKWVPEFYIPGGAPWHSLADPPGRRVHNPCWASRSTRWDAARNLPWRCWGSASAPPCQYSHWSMYALHPSPDGRGTDAMPHGPRCAPILQQEDSPEDAVPHRYLAPNGSSHEDCRCSGAACPGWIAPENGHGIMRDEVTIVNGHSLHVEYTKII